MAEDKLIGFKINSKGYGTIPKLIMQDKNLCIGAKGLYAYFCSFSGGGDTCFPSRNKICFDLCISVDSFTKYLKQLITNGYIQCEQIKEHGKFSHNVYTLCDTIFPCSENTVSEISVYGKTDTNNNNYNNNNSFNNNSTVSKEEKENFADIEENTTFEKINNLQDKEISTRLIALFKNKKIKNKPITKEVLKVILDRLEKFSEGDRNKALEILDMSVSKGYTDVFPVVQYQQLNRNQPTENYSAYNLDDYEKTITDNYEEYLKSWNI